MSKPETRPRLSLKSDPSEWREALGRGDRFALSRLLTFSESTSARHREFVSKVLEGAKESGAFRIGVTGSPGVGKSTLLENLGMFLIDKGLSVCVLSIDPSSPVTGGSVLGDKTRMNRLSAEEKAFIRPIPSGAGLGGLSHGTPSGLRLCEAANFNVILVETVGVGQSEVDVWGLVDTLLLLVAPAMGDELQGFKRGLMEHVNVLAVTKSDLDPNLAETTLRAYLSALKFLQPSSTTSGVAVDSISGKRLDELWDLLSRSKLAVSPEQRLERARGRSEQLLIRAISDRVTELVRRAAQENHLDEIRLLTEQQAKGELTVRDAAMKLLTALRLD